MQIRVLGPLGAQVDGRAVALGPPKQRLVLALLVCQVGRPVSADRLIDALWGPYPPPSAEANLRGYVHGLRRALGSEYVRGRGQPGYVFQLPADQLDAVRFAELARAGARALDATRTEEAQQLLHDALALRRGPPFADLGDHPALAADIARLNEQLLATLELRIDADLACGEHASLVSELTTLATEYPYREHIHAQLMRALYRSGRQADALTAYENVRRLLVEELGVQPGAELRRLHRAILRSEPDLDLPPPGARTGMLAIPAQLPASVPDFTGRTRQLSELDRLATQPDAAAGVVPITTITGTAGVGKTALAVQWAHRNTGAYPDGQLYVNLRGYHPDSPLQAIHALAHFLTALGVESDKIPADEESAAALYRSLLADRRMLVVLDNASSAGQVRPLLPGRPGCLVLVTSRALLAGLIAHDGARALNLDVLTDAESIELLGKILGTDRIRAEPGAADLAAACCHLPLALRIAAANLAVRPERSIAEHVKELTGGDRLLGLTIDGDQSVGVRAAFDQSYSGLSAMAQRLFRWLGLIPGPDFTEQAAAVLLARPDTDTRALLDQLAGGHLIESHRPGRYTFHDLLRSYASECSHRLDSSSDRLGARARLFDYYVGHAHDAVRLLHPHSLRLPLPTELIRAPVHRLEHERAMAWLDAELPNLVATAIHAASHGPAWVAWQLADTLRAYFGLRLRPTDWRLVAQAGLAAADRSGDSQARAAARLNMANLTSRLGQDAAAAGYYRQAMSMAEQAGWLNGQAFALGGLGQVHNHNGQPRQATLDLHHALKLSRATGRLASQAVVLSDLGVAYWELGALEQAVDHYQQAIEIFAEIGGTIGQAIARTNIGEACRGLGHLDEATQQLNQALDVHRAAGNQALEAISLSHLAGVHLDTGQITSALDLADRAVSIARDSGDHRYQAEALTGRAMVYARQERYQDAVTDHNAALALAEETGGPLPQAQALVAFADTCRLNQTIAQAILHAQAALHIARRHEFRMIEAQALTTLAAAHLLTGERTRALRVATEALAIHRATGHRLGQSRTTDVLRQLSPETTSARGR